MSKLRRDRATLARVLGYALLLTGSRIAWLPRVPATRDPTRQFEAGAKPTAMTLAASFARLSSKATPWESPMRMRSR